MVDAQPGHENVDPLRWMKRSPWQWFPPLQWLQRYLIGFGVGYVEFTGDPEQLWRDAMRHAPISFRWFGASLAIDDIDAELEGYEAWQTAKQQFQAGDKIWPFVINPHTFAMRLGYIIVRKHQPVTGIVTVVS